jgi:hypothetical protein
VVDNNVVIALVTTFGTVISGLIGHVIRQLYGLTSDIHALKTHFKIKVVNGVAVPIEDSSTLRTYEARE